MDTARIDAAAGEPPAEITDHFQGSARLQQLPLPFAGHTSVFAVHFEPGGRSKPHVHPHGQLLVITAGRGLVGSDSGVTVVGPGDVVASAPGEWHWHGATPDSPLTHLTVQPAVADSVDWDVDERDWATTYHEPR